MASQPDTRVRRWVERLERHAESGKPIDLAPDSPCDPSTANTWSDERTLPAAALRDVLTRRNLDVHPVGLRIRGARITDYLDLAYITFSHPLELRDCCIQGNINMQGAVLKALTLIGTHMRAMLLDDAEIARTLFASQGFKADGFVRAVRARIGQLVLSGASIANAGGDALILSGAEIKDGLSADAGFRAEGAFCAAGARIGADLNLSGAILIKPGGDALTLDFVEIAGALRAEGLKSRGGFSAVGDHVGRNLVLNGARLFNTGGNALVLDGGEIAGSLFATNGFRASGGVTALSVHIGNQMVLSGASFANPIRNADGEVVAAADAIALDGAVIGTMLAANAGFRADGLGDAGGG